MKLKTKLTLSYIFLVIIVMTISFLAFTRTTSVEFDKFLIDEQNYSTHNIPKNMIRRQLENNPSIQPNKLMELINKRPLKRMEHEQKFMTSIHLSFLFSGLIGLFFAIILGWWISKLQTRKIYELKNALSTYKNDGIPMKLSIDTDDEIGELTRSYNNLISQLNKQDTTRKEFFTDMSHELRTPLTSIRGYIESIADGVIKPNQRVLGNTLKEIERMNHLIKGLLNLSRIESEKISLNKTDVDLRKLVKEITDTLYSSGDNRIIIQGKGEINADKDKIKQVLINLISNAVSYKKEKTKIEININEKNKYTIFEISNLVVINANSNIDLFFERFYREDKSRKYDATNPHLGIGLTIVKKIVEAHQGNIKIEKQKNKIKIIVQLPK